MKTCLNMERWSFKIKLGKSANKKAFLDSASAILLKHTGHKRALKYRKYVLQIKVG